MFNCAPPIAHPAQHNANDTTANTAASARPPRIFPGTVRHTREAIQNPQYSPAAPEAGKVKIGQRSCDLAVSSVKTAGATSATAKITQPARALGDMPDGAGVLRGGSGGGGSGVESLMAAES